LLGRVGGYYNTYKANSFIPDGTGCVYGGSQVDYDAVTSTLVDNQGLTTSFNNKFFEPFTNLTFIDISSNLITVFEAANLSGLEALYLSYNLITDFDGTGLSNLQELYFSHNQLSNFNGAGISSAYYLALDNNQLVDVDITEMIGLQELDLAVNQLTSLDVSQNTSLEYLYLQNNLLNSLANSQVIVDLDSNGNTAGYISTTIVGGGFITPTAVDSATALQGNAWSIVGVPLALTNGVTYNVADFPKIWIDNLMYNTAGNKGDTFVAAGNYAMTGQVAYNAVTEINLNSKSLTTIFNNELLSKFTALKNLYLLNNSIPSLDAQSLLLLERLYITNSNNIVLTNIEFCTNLEILYADNCGLSNIDFTNFPNLQRLFGIANNFTNLDFSLSNDLQLLRINNNPLLQSLNVNNCSLLTEIEAHNSILNVLNIDDCVVLTKVYAQNANLTAFSVANNPLLNNLRIPNNQLDNLVNSQILIDLDSNGLSNGYLQTSIFGGGTLTTAALTAKSNLQGKGWNVVGI
jgi:hypothetical protein